MNSKKLIILLITTLTFILSPILFIYSQDEDEDAEIGRGLDNREKDNFYRDEIYLEGLLTVPKYYPILIDRERKEDENLLYRNIAGYYEETVIPDIKNPYVKPYSILYEDWYFADGIGINKIDMDQVNQVPKNLKQVESHYYKAFYNAKNSRLIRVEKRYREYIQEIYIYNEKHQIKYQIEFKYNKLTRFIDYLYDSDDKLIRKNYYEDGHIVEYITYQYHKNKKLKLVIHKLYDGTPTGVWKYYNDKEYVIKKEKYKNGIFDSYIAYQYDEKSGIEILRQYFDMNLNLMKYWVREDKIKYYNDKGIEISWNDFFHNNLGNLDK